MFLAKDTNGEDLTQVKFDENKVIRTIHGDDDGYWMKKIHLKDKDNNEIAKIEAFNDNPGQEVHLNEGEEIIGIYGNKDTINFFYNLGFIVWTPHYDWIK